MFESLPFIENPAEPTPIGLPLSQPTATDWATCSATRSVDGAALARAAGQVADRLRERPHILQRLEEDATAV